MVKYILDRKKTTATTARWSFALESAIVSFSDQQLVTGISIIIGGFSRLEWGLPVYHFQEVGNLAWFSTMTHILTLTVLREKLRISSRIVIKTIRVILMGCLVILLIVVMAPVGYINSVYGYWGSITVGNYNSTFYEVTSELPIPLGFPAWCLYHRAAEWEDEDGVPIVKSTPYGYNVTDVVLTLGLIIYGYITRVALLFPGLFLRSMLRIAPGQPWGWVESGLQRFQILHDARRSPTTPAGCFVNVLKKLGNMPLYSFYVLVVSGTQVYGSKIWELSWLTLALIWGTIRIFYTRSDSYSGISMLLASDVEAISQQNVWGFGQVVALVLLSLPSINFLGMFQSYPIFFLRLT